MRDARSQPDPGAARRILILLTGSRTGRGAVATGGRAPVGGAVPGPIAGGVTDGVAAGVTGGGTSADTA